MQPNVKITGEERRSVSRTPVFSVSVGNGELVIFGKDADTFFSVSGYLLPSQPEARAGL